MPTTTSSRQLSIHFLDRLSTKIAITAVVFLFALTSAIAFLVDDGLRDTQYNAYSTSQKILEEQARASLARYAAAEANLLEMHLNQSALQVLSMAALLESNPRAPKEMGLEWIGPALAGLLEQNSDLSAVYFLNPYGDMIYQPTGANPAAWEDVFASPVYQLAAGQPELAEAVWSGPHKLQPNAEDVLSVSTAVATSGQLLGVVAAHLPLARVASYIDQIQPVPGSYALLLDRQGRPVVLTSTGRDHQLGDSSLDSGGSNTDPAALPEGTLAIFGRLSGLKPGAENFQIAGKPVLIVSAPLNNPAWNLALVASLETINTQSEEVANSIWTSAEATINFTLVMLISFFLAAVLITLLLLERLFNRRIAALLQGVRAITAGDLRVSIPDSPSDELGLLASAFNRMASELQRRNAALEESHLVLEQRVEESTREVKQLYAQSEARSRELEILYRADEQLYRHLHLDQVLEALVDVVIDDLQADKASVQVWDPSTQRLLVRAVRGYIPETADRMSEYIPGDGIAGKVFQSGEIIAVEDATTAPHPADQIAAVEGIRSVLSVPITIGGKIFGVFGMDYCQARSFSTDDKRLFMALAQRAAIAIENAQLYEQAGQAATLEERQRLARELHDAVTQSLYSLVLLSEAGRRHARSGNLEHVEHHLERLGETAQQALKEMRLLVYELRPLALHEVGLAGALQQRLEAVEKRAGIQARLFVEGQAELPAPLDEELYRIAQEALNNALKHAAASHVNVRLKLDPEIIQLEILDNGRGFDPEHSDPAGIGLQSMRERASRLGATLDTESAPGSGTTIRVYLHLAGESKARISNL